MIVCDALLTPTYISSKLRASGPRAPEVSIAIGTKWWDLGSRAYFSFFLASAAVATALASLVHIYIYYIYI